jgi:hypothetical protein
MNEAAGAADAARVLWSHSDYSCEPLKEVHMTELRQWMLEELQRHKFPNSTEAVYYIR